MEVEQLPKSPGYVAAPGPTHPRCSVLQGHPPWWVEGGDVLQAQSLAGIGGQELARHGRGVPGRCRWGARALWGKAVALTADPVPACWMLPSSGFVSPGFAGKLGAPGEPHPSRSPTTGDRPLLLRGAGDTAAG